MLLYNFWLMTPVTYRVGPQNAVFQISPERSTIPEHLLTKYVFFFVKYLSSDIKKLGANPS